jgi:hypothetical protein
MLKGVFKNVAMDGYDPKLAAPGSSRRWGRALEFAGIGRKICANCQRALRGVAPFAVSEERPSFAFAGLSN